MSFMMRCCRGSGDGCGGQDGNWCHSSVVAWCWRRYTMIEEGKERHRIQHAYTRQPIKTDHTLTYRSLARHLLPHQLFPVVERARRPLQLQWVILWVDSWERKRVSVSEGDIKLLITGATHYIYSNSWVLPNKSFGAETFIMWPVGTSDMNLAILHQWFSVLASIFYLFNSFNSFTAVFWTGVYLCPSENTVCPIHNDLCVQRSVSVNYFILII